MSTVFCTIGFTGSGKSTFAKNFIKDKPKTKIVSPDVFRKMFNGRYKYDILQDDIITKCCYDTAKHLLIAGYDIVIDCGNLTKAMDRRALWKLLKSEKFAEKFVAFVMPMDKPVEWYVERRKTNPHWDKVNWEQIVRAEMKAYEPPTPDEFDEIWEILEHETTTEYSIEMKMEK